MNIRNRWTTRAAACLRRRLSQVRTDDGFTIVEVVVTAAMVAMIAGGAFAGIEATGHASSELRHRSIAQELAQQDQERMRGMSIQQLSGLSETRPVTLDGTNYTVKSKGTFLGGSGGSSCSDQAADYVQITSTVDWASDTRTQVTPGARVQVHSIVSPPAGGTILVHVHDDLNIGQAGVTATVAGGSDRFDAVTDSQGCAYFSGLALGGYYVLAAKPAAGSNAGWVTPDGTSTAVTGVGTSAAGTKTAELELAQAGGVTASFKTTAGLNGEAAGLSWIAPRMTAAGHFPVTGTSSSPTPLPASTVPTAQVVTPLTLYPFHNSGVTTDNYEVWAGRCGGDQVLPATSAFKSKASVAPNNGGSTTTPTAVMVPAMVSNVYWKPSASSTTGATWVKPSHIQLTDACSDNWQATVTNPGTTLATPTNAFTNPGQAYGTYGRVCVDFDPPGLTPVYRAILPTSFSNTNFTSTGNTIFNSTVGTTKAMTITGGVSANQKLCSSP